MNAIYIVAVAVVVVAMTTVESRDNFYDETVQKLGQTAQLYCNESYEYSSAPNDSIPVSWMLPNLTVFSETTGKYHIVNNNWTLEVVNVTRDDIGLYHCMLKTPTFDWYIVRAGLNAEGPYFEDLWQKYDLNTYIGLAAFFGFLALALICWLLYRFRYREDKDESDAGSSSSSSSSSSRSHKEEALPNIYITDENAASNNVETSPENTVQSYSNPAYWEPDSESVTTF